MRLRFFAFVQKNTMSKFGKTFPGVAAAALVCALAFAAVPIPSAYAGTPCCNVKSVRVGQLVTVDPGVPVNGIAVINDLKPR